ncbi:MAG: serine/threonine protein kinase [Planctomycetes bacterium]|nr:serine/threonine protein kinase [Planctomycetota bacterium]
MKIEPGVVLADRYVVERTLGQGGMGAVYEALDRKFGARVALKVAAATGAGHDEFKARFAREARLGHRLGRRRGVVRALDWGELPDGVRLYLALDLVAGARPLDLQAGPLPERLRRLLRAAEIVADAHAQGIVHRDLKPANLLEGADGELYLTDFGLAKATGDDEADPDGSALTAPVTRSGLGFGTPLFMAPEQFEDAKRADARADVYALGVMLFVALTGEYPFPGASPTSILLGQQRVLEGLSPAPTPGARRGDVPEALDRLCAEAIALRPEERLASAAAFADGLRAALPAADAPVTLGAAPTLPPRRPAFTSQAPGATSGASLRRRVTLALAAAAAAWLALAVVVNVGGRPAAFALRVLPVAPLVDFTAPQVELEGGPIGVRGASWTATRVVVVTGEARDASPRSVTAVHFPGAREGQPAASGRPVIGPLHPLVTGVWAQRFEVPLELPPTPGPWGISLWVRDEADNEEVVGLTLVYQPVEVALTIARIGDGSADVIGQLSPAPPGPYRVIASGVAPTWCEGARFELTVPVAPGQTEVELHVAPPRGQPVRAVAPLP